MRKFVRWLPFSARGLELIASGTKTQTIIPLARFDWVRRLRRGMVLQAGPAPWHHDTGDVDPVWIKIDSVCVHEHLADITVCPQGHSPSSMNPEQTTWSPVLNDASMPKMRAHKREQLASMGWAVMRFGLVDAPQRALGSRISTQT